MLEDLNTAMQSGSEFLFNEFAPGVLSLDLIYLAFALALLGLILVFLLIMFKAGGWVIAFIKKLILLGILASSGYLVVTSFSDKLSVEAIQAASLETILIGVIGLLVLVVALGIALSSLGKHSKKRHTYEEKHDIPFEPTTINQPTMFSTQALTNQLKTDRSLLAVISYVIIAEFGIFSSKTFPAPNPTVGLIFFGVFFFGAFIFIKTTYKNYLKGITHLLVASVFAVGLSIFLGHLWGEIPLPLLLSFDYFGTTALVAVLTGIAVSLLLGSKG